VGNRKPLYCHIQVTIEAVGPFLPGSHVDMQQVDNAIPTGERL
jgi:hypothetical protein